MGERIRNQRIPYAVTPKKGRTFAPVICPATPGFDILSPEAVLGMQRNRVNDVRHILDVRKSRAKAPDFSGRFQSQTVHHLNRNSRVALHTERTQLADRSHRAKKG